MSSLRLSNSARAAAPEPLVGIKLKKTPRTSLQHLFAGKLTMASCITPMCISMRTEHKIHKQ
jgi:hypothetical protein